MRTEPNAPWWLAAAVTALPVALAAFLVVTFPPGARTTPAAAMYTNTVHIPGEGR